MANLKKGDLEKIYTPSELTLHLIKVLRKYVIETDIVEFLEPAAGNGAIVDVLKQEFPNTPVFAFDIYNEDNRDDITEMDLFKLQNTYKKGRVTIMNPPFTKAIRFINKVIEMSDYVVVITGSTTFLNLDYEKYEVLHIDIIRDYKFSNDKKYTICVMLLKNKNI